MSDARNIKKIATEHEDQLTLVQWANFTSFKQKNGHESIVGRYLVAIPNGEARPFVVSKSGVRVCPTGKKLQKAGVKKGFPDLMLLIPTERHHGLFIELKRKKGSTVTAEQMEWLTKLNLMGYCAKVCYGVDDAIKTIVEYLGERHE